MKKILVIFTDLDGTLLNEKYSFKDALPGLKVITDNQIPLICSTSKTRAEIEHWRKKLLNRDPFISENGGGIFIPRNSNIKINKSKLKIDEMKEYFVIKLGADYRNLRAAVFELRDEGFDIKGFGDMTEREICDLTGLKLSDAKRAKQRDFDEPFILVSDTPPFLIAGKMDESDNKIVRRLKRSIKSKGYNFTAGEFFHIMGDSNKGRAVEILKELYKERGRDVITAALGDSPNDIEMLQRVDYPVVVQKKDYSYNTMVIKNVKGCIKADGIGPVGWNNAVKKLVETLLM